MTTAYELIHLKRSQTPVRSARRYSLHALALLDFFTRHRIALASHVQRQFPAMFHSERATRMHLQTLVAQGHVDRITQGMGQPNVYLITGKGLRALQQMEHPRTLNDLPQELRRPSESHLIHELLITELAVTFTEVAQRRPDVQIPWSDRFGLVRSPAFRFLIPDYAFLVQHAFGGLCCFVEVSSGEESPKRMKQKLDLYTDWARSPDAQEFLITLYQKHGAEEPRPQFRLVLVVQDRRTGNDHGRLSEFFRGAADLPRSMRERIWATTVDALRETASIEDPVWLRVRDLHREQTEWETLPVRVKRRQLRLVLSQLPRHRFFPSPENPRHETTSQDQSDRVEHPARSEQRGGLCRSTGQ